MAATIPAHHRISRSIREKRVLDLFYIGMTLVWFGAMAAFIFICEKLLAGATDRSGSKTVTTRYSKNAKPATKI